MEFDKAASNIDQSTSTRLRLPPWLRRRPPKARPVAHLRNTAFDPLVNTVCEQAKCPNRGECYARKTATFLLCGHVCTRTCSFCAIEYLSAPPLNPDEPEAVAKSVEALGLKYVVLTMVNRDDLPDGGAAHVVRVLQAIRARVGDVPIEVLASDFNGNLDSVQKILDAQPVVFNHNIETVPRLYAVVRPEAIYERSLGVLQYAAECVKREASRVKRQSNSHLQDTLHASRFTLEIKSGLMIGLGETDAEVLQVLKDLRAHGVTVVTIGQYLRPSPRHAEVQRYSTPEHFRMYRDEGMKLGFKEVFSHPFVRSSYHAGETYFKVA